MHGKLLEYMNRNHITKLRLADILGYSYVGIRKKFSDGIPFNTVDVNKLLKEFDVEYKELF